MLFLSSALLLACSRNGGSAVGAHRRRCCCCCCCCGELCRMGEGGREGEHAGRDGARWRQCPRNDLSLLSLARRARLCLSLLPSPLVPWLSLSPSVALGSLPSKKALYAQRCWP